MHPPNYALGFRVLSGIFGAYCCQILLRLHPPRFAPSVVTKCSHFSLGPFLFCLFSSFLLTKDCFLFIALFGYQLFPVTVLNYQWPSMHMFIKHWTSTVHIAVLGSVESCLNGVWLFFFLWQKIGVVMNSLIWNVVPSLLGCLAGTHQPHPLCMVVLCLVIGGWNMKHPEHQCWHRDSWRDPAEDYPHTGRGTDFLILFSLSSFQVQMNPVNYIIYLDWNQWWMLMVFTKLSVVNIYCVAEILFYLNWNYFVSCSYVLLLFSCLGILTLTSKLLVWLTLVRTCLITCVCTLFWGLSCVIFQEPK